MKKQLIAAGIIASTLFALTAKKTDPTLMNVAGKDVPLSEFEYLYHKNNTQQSEPQSIDQYVGMFINYKMKVADAEAAGLDTTAAFREEFVKFRNELADPYFQDTTVLEPLLKEAYNHLGEEVLVSHLMVRDGQQALIDSLRAGIVNGSIKFEEAAHRYSVDPPSANRGGLMGIVVPGRYPWAFEEMAYNTAVGEVSPVVNSGFGLHIIRVEKRSPARGEVKASHILRSTRSAILSEERQKEIIDSIYEVVSADPSKFAEVAIAMSEDPGSGRRGGDLGWFGPGMMVAEFDSLAFALPVGAVSKPFKTQFGWHIMKKDDARGIGSFDENREELLKQIKAGDRGKEPHRAFVRNAAKKYNARLLPENIAKIADMADATGGKLDETFIETYSHSDLPLFMIGTQAYSLGELLSQATPMPVNGGEAIQKFIESQAETMMNGKVLDLAREELYVNNDDYRNLVNEYRDGILLYEISNRNVWDKAAKDREGLEAYFQAHKDKYAFDQPKYKAFIVFATSDSILTEALQYAETLPLDMEPTEIVKSIKDKFGREVKVERVIAAKGENAFTDYLGFGEPAPENNNNRWKYIGAFRGHIIDEPEEAADVRGAAVTDYQEVLEQEWISVMKKRYKAKVNNKVLKELTSEKNK